MWKKAAKNTNSFGLVTLITIARLNNADFGICTDSEANCVFGNISLDAPIQTRYRTPAHCNRKNAIILIVKIAPNPTPTIVK